MSETTFQKLHRKHFIDCVVALMDFWVESFPNQPTIATARESRIKLTGMVKGSDERELAALKDWDENMRTPLDASAVRYAASLRRLLGEDGTLYHAVAYKDLPAIMASAKKFETLIALDPMTCLESKPECTAPMWQMLQTINGHATQYFDNAVRIPTPAEISQEIKLHKASKAPSRPAMARGFDTTFDTLIEKLHIQTPPSVDMAEWATPQVKAACESQNLTELRSALATCAPWFKDVDDGLIDASVWKLIAELHSFAGVSATVNTNLMSRIEATAHRLAGEVATGKTDLASLNLQELGESVLAGSNPEDIQALASGMGNLLPMLSTLQQGMAPR